MKKFTEYLSEEKKNVKTEGPLPIVYLDLDEVMVDFLGGAKEVLGHDFNDRSKRTTNEVWAMLDAKKDFWEQLKPKKDALVLWKFLKKHDPNILSAVPLSPDAKPGKRKWVKKHLGIHNDSRINLVKRPEKALFAQTNGKPNLLIDDYLKNINEFKSAGGIGIHHISVNKTISQLKKLGY